MRMACSMCNTKLNFFKRKRYCIDCQRHFCTDCVLKRLDKLYTCESCVILSTRPLIRNQVRYMRSKDLRQYLLAKHVSIKGCVEKEDLINILMVFANGPDYSSNQVPDSNYQDTSAYNARTENTVEPVPHVSSSRGHPEDIPTITIEDDNKTENTTQEDIQTVSSQSEDVECIEEDSDNAENLIIHIPNSDSEDSRIIEEDVIPMTSSNIEIEEVLGDDSPVDTPDPIITEQDELSEVSNNKQADMITEVTLACKLWPDKIQLSDIKEFSELEYLNIKQLKMLLSTNRVNYKGCIEKHELLSKVSRLWQEYKSSREDVEKLTEEDLCKICWDAPIECVLLECGHMACCINCGKQMSECPICKQFVVRIVRFFKA